MELLVVASILALLVALLLPALREARRMAQRVECASDQRQIYTGLTTYASDHFGYYPVNRNQYIDDVAADYFGGGPDHTDVRPAYRRYVGRTAVFYDPALPVKELESDEFASFRNGSFRRIWYTHYIIPAGRHDIPDPGYHFRRADGVTPYDLHRVSDATDARTAIACVAASVPNLGRFLGTTETPYITAHGLGGEIGENRGERHGATPLGNNSTTADGSTRWTDAEDPDFQVGMIRKAPNPKRDVHLFWRVRLCACSEVVDRRRLRRRGGGRRTETMPMRHPAKRNRRPGILRRLLLIGLTAWGGSLGAATRAEVIDLRQLPGSEAGHVVKGEGKFPRFAQFDDGALFVATHRGSHQPAPDNSLQGFLSTDGGRTWSEPRQMFRQRGVDPRSPAVGVGPDGVLYAAWRERRWDEPADSRVAFYRSENRGKSWAFVAEVEMPSNDRVGHPYGKLLFDGGRIFLPVYTIARSGQGRMDSRLFVSDDGGKTWRQRSIIREKANETFLTRRPNGDLLAFVRDDQPRAIDGKLHLTTSKDNGRTWSEPTRLTDRGRHPAEAVFIGERTLVCFYGHRREPYGVRGVISHDAGRTWRDDVELLVDDTWSHFDCGYPTAAIVDDGETLLIAWYVNRDGSGNLQRDRQCRTLRVNLQQLRAALP